MVLSTRFAGVFGVGWCGGGGGGGGEGGGDRVPITEATLRRGFNASLAIHGPISDECLRRRVVIWRVLCVCQGLYSMLLSCMPLFFRYLCTA